MNNNFDTIVAIITPLALSAVGIIRISGDKAFEIAQKIFDKKIKPKMINYGHIKDGENVLDEVILLPFKGPNSYTGEDVVEIQTHGSLVILNSVLELILSLGARMAQKGEFTKRAFLNHRIDLSQAESVMDIIEAKSQKAAQDSLSNLGGYLKEKTNEIKNNLVELYSRLIAAIDFPEDVKEVDTKAVVSICSDNILKIEEILNNSKSHNFIRDGISACLIGKPNVGKSSLFNSLLNYQRAIVTQIEGTTRDTIKETLNLGGYLVNFIDTAGIRDKNKADLVEQIGIDNSIETIKNSQIVLFLFENSLNEIEPELIELAKDKKAIFVHTKSDLNPEIIENAINISTKDNNSISNLKDEILKVVKELIPQETSYTTNKRQQDCFLKCLNSLKMVLKTATEPNFFDDCADLYTLDLKQAIIELDEITGEVLTDKILDNIFENFCIGK